MKVYELFENILTEADEIAAIKRDLQDLQSEINDIKHRGGSLGHGGILPQYIARMDRLKARQTALRSQLAIINSNNAARQDLGRDWDREQSELKTNPEAKAARNSAAISQGLTTSYQLKQKLGGYQGIVDDILKDIIRLTDNRTKPLEIDVLADRYDVGIRTIHKWLERPEFRPLRKYMPHMYR